MSKIFKPRRGQKSTMNGPKANTVLAAGEMFFEIPNGGLNSGPGRIMLGDGTSAYSALKPFMEQTDVSTAQVTVTADNSSTSTAALNNVATGATTGAIVGSLKQAISLTKSELTNTIDDNVSTLQSNFQAGVNSVYNAVVAKGVTPASYSLSDIITGIGNIATATSIVWKFNSKNSSWGQYLPAYTYNTFYLDNVDSYTEADYTHTGDAYCKLSLNTATHRLTVSTCYSSASYAIKTITITPIQS